MIFITNILKQFLLFQVLTSECDQLNVLGYFNLPNILWLPNDDCFGLHTSCTIPWICDFLDTLFDCGLSQINYLKNPCNNILDLPFVDLSICGIECSDPLSIPEDGFYLTFKLCFNIDKILLIPIPTNHQKRFLTLIELNI